MSVRVNEGILRGFLGKIEVPQKRAGVAYRHILKRVYDPIKGATISGLSETNQTDGLRMCDRFSHHFHLNIETRSGRERCGRDFNRD